MKNIEIEIELINQNLDNIVKSLEFLIEGVRVINQKVVDLEKKTKENSDSLVCVWHRYDMDSQIQELVNKGLLSK